MKTDHVLAIDQGTTGTTVLLFDRDGGIAGRAYSEHRQHFPRPGWVEHDPEEIWDVTSGLLRRVLQMAEVVPSRVAAVGITNQRETTVLWDRETGRPVHPAIVWQCRRSAPLCESLRADGATPLIRERTGLLPDPYFSGTKLRWLLDHVPHARARAEAGELAFGTMDSWLLWKLSGGELHVTEPTNACRTLLYDIHRRCWDPELLDLLGIPPAVLPELRGSMEVFGHTAESSPLGPGVPLAGAAGDQQAALFGQGCLEPGMAKNTYGTGCFLMMNTGDRAVISPSGLLTTLAVGADGRPCYALEGSVFIGGAVLQWLRDGLGLIESAPEADRIAAEVSDTGGVYLVPAFSGLGAPHWDMHARGAILGLTGGTTREQVIRAAVESIAFQSCDLLQAMEADAEIPVRELRVDGGACRSDVLMQLQADLSGLSVDRPEETETTAAGAAYLAGLATGFYQDAAELARLRRRERLFSPTMDASERNRRYNGWTQAIRRVMTREPGRNE